MVSIRITVSSKKLIEFLKVYTCVTDKAVGAMVLADRI